MKSKDKATDLIYKFSSLVKINESQIELTERRAKQCALICVDEIISNRSQIHMKNKLYWKEVKKEIENYE